MIALLLALAVQAAEAPPPESWGELPLLPVAPGAASLEGTYRFVAGEVAAGRCAAATVADGATTVKVLAVVRIREDGQIAAIRPQAIGCATVEQYATGLIQRIADLGAQRSPPPGWYRTGLTFRWTTRR